MSDFPSISDLVSNNKKQKVQTDKDSQSLGTASASQKLKKKMTEVKEKEREVQTMREAAKKGFPHIDLENFPINQEALRQLPKEEAEKLQAVCFYATPAELRIGAIDPTDKKVEDLMHRLQERNHAHGIIYAISEDSLNRVLKLYENLPVIKPVSKDIQIKEEELEKVKANVNDFRSLQELLNKKSVTDLLVFLLGASLKLDASDLHIEAEEEGIIVRLRLDGILHDAAELPKDAYKKLISRIKLVSSLKINITDKPQDGRFTIKLKNGDVDVRVSTIPTIYGESVVMRLLRQDRKGLTLDKLGISGSAFDKLMVEIQRPNGMIIATGPTGSGKTTTLYAIMQLLNKPGVKIITLEDPVEYKIEGINQSQIDRSKEYTFASGLRSMLRQDPDIAMVGEIRDLETADIAIQASLTGHLMLSTIHTNNASGAIPRFLSMGVKPFLLAPALNCVIGQRLVRKLCDECKKETKLSESDLKRVNKIIESMPEKDRADLNEKNLTFYEPGECTECNNIGYSGRVGIYEIFVMIKEIEEMVLSTKVSETEIEETAIKNGMMTMVQDGIKKAAQGITSVSEVFRVIE
ncbi:MAG: hypothetical protein GF349_00980 [Candidatus Magasanikbacteria bacterium]|nr:hypothetical protein [Candidatus Magasanikbacteria bacterium]